MVHHHRYLLSAQTALHTVLSKLVLVKLPSSINNHSVQRKQNQVIQPKLLYWVFKERLVIRTGSAVSPAQVEGL
jgi:hypothetical protein